MTGEQSVTFWLDQLKAGDREAVQPLWERYFGQLVVLARRRLQGVRRAAADEEDVALSAFDHFCRAVAVGRFPQLQDRDDLWRLLVVITERQAIDLARRQGRARRGGGLVVGESGIEGAGGLAAVPAPEPTPEFAALLAEESERLLALLPDPVLRQLALLKLEGHANEAIAARLGCALRTVERKLALIRETWNPEVNR
ncbi:MAG: RNA polymerase subunit sigma-70 [Gemmataceae bacterium]|nr:RNA polymerase subunit sigma-70 [Gemmataceae bacterium]